VWACRFQRFFLYVALDTSPWILAAVTVERFLAVCMPQLHPAIKTAPRAWLIVLGIVVFQLGFNSHVFFNYGKQIITGDNQTEVFSCGFSSPAARKYIVIYQGYILLALYCVIPFIIMLTLNILIIKRLHKVKKSFEHRNMSIKSQRRQTRSHSLTKMLLTVTFYFILVSTPNFIYTLIQSKLLDTKNFTAQEYAQTEIIDAVCTLLLYLNHTLNFFLYCVSGRRFRKQLTSMLKCGAGTTKRGSVTYMPSQSDNHKSFELPSMEKQGTKGDAI